jgi:hypothetical protein
MWMTIAASRASGELKEGWRSGDSIAQKMTAEQIAEAERLAGEWKPREQATARTERDSQP